MVLAFMCTGTGKEEPPPGVGEGTRVVVGKTSYFLPAMGRVLVPLSVLLLHVAGAAGKQHFKSLMVAFTSGFGGPRISPLVIGDETNDAMS